MVGGTYSDLQLTSMGLIVSKTYDGVYMRCTGTLVGPREVLTAAHCLENVEGGIIVLGGTIYEGVEFIPHPGYTGNRDITQVAMNDVGVMVLREAPNRIEQKPLVSGRSLRIGDNLTVYGYGANESSSNAESAGDMLSRGKYGSFIVTNLWNGVAEATYAASSTAICPGDSGGPGMLSIGGTPAIATVSSYGSSEVDGIGACFTRNGTLSGFADLNSPSNIEFLKRFPGIKRVAEVIPAPKQPSDEGDPVSPNQMSALRNELRKHYLAGRKILRLSALNAIRERSAALGDEVSFLAEEVPAKVRRTVAKAGSNLELASKQRTRKAALKKVTSAVNLLLRASRSIK